MNEGHAQVCASPEWADHIATVVLPEALADFPLGAVLEIGPGYGASTAQLAGPGVQLTVVESDARLAADLVSRFPGVTVVNASGAALPFPQACFAAVVCFTMLHHVASRAQQDALFAEACRVLEPGGLFAGTDSIASPGRRDFHRGDTYVPVDPTKLAARLRRAGFAEIDVRVTAPGERFAFRASAPR